MELGANAKGSRARGLVRAPAQRLPGGSGAGGRGPAARPAAMKDLVRYVGAASVLGLLFSALSLTNRRSGAAGQAAALGDVELAGGTGYRELSELAGDPAAPANAHGLHVPPPSAGASAPAPRHKAAPALPVREISRTRPSAPVPLPPAAHTPPSPSPPGRPLSAARHDLEAQPQADFSVAWHPRKKPPRGQNPAADADDGPAQNAEPEPWQKARAEAARRIKEAQMVAPGDITRRVKAQLAKQQDAVNSMKKRRAADPDNAELKRKTEQLDADLRATGDKLEAIARAEEEKEAHKRSGADAQFAGPDPVWAGLLSPPPKISVTYESCVRSLRASGKHGRPKTLQNPNWIHFPKAGTTFATTLYGYLCTARNASGPPALNAVCSWCGTAGKQNHGGLQWDPKTWPIIPFEAEPYCDWNISLNPRRVFSNHFSVPRENAGSLVALFRDPRKRLVSAWNNNKHSYGGNRAVIEAAQNLPDFINAPGIQSCQTKMVIGDGCSGTRQLKDGDMELAKQMLSDKFQFVGLTEAFNASVCLFHHMFGGEPREYSFQAVGLERSSEFLFHHYHRTKKYKPLPGGGERLPPNAWMKVSTDDDKWDWQLYQHAVSVFVSRLREHKLLPAG